MNKPELLNLITELQKEINRFDGDVREDFIPTDILGCPMIVRALSDTIPKIMLAALAKNN